MKHLFLALIAIAMLGISSLSYSKNEPIDSKNNAQQYIKMHQSIIKLHQDAISCLQSDKTVSECTQQFRKSMMAHMKKMKKDGKMMPCPMMQNQMKKSSGGMMMQSSS